VPKAARVESLTTKARIRAAALALFAERGVGGTSLREVARAAGVAPGLVVHHFGSKAGLQEAVEDLIVDLLREALESVPPVGTPAAVGRGRDAAMAALFAGHPDVLDYVRRVIVTPEPGDGLAAKIVDLSVAQNQVLRDHGLSRSAASATEQAVEVLTRQLGNLLLQPAVERLWALAGENSRAPTVRVTLNR
jgi:AcrR family transcriptional regulator